MTVAFLGLGIAYALGRALSGLLSGVDPTDLPTPGVAVSR